MFRNARYRAIIIQATVLVVVIILLITVGKTTVENIQERGIPLGIDFLQFRAGLTISESLLPYNSDNSYLWAIIVGIGNTLLVWFIVAILATILGIVLGMSRLSENPLVRGLSSVWVESARNTPPILLLIFLYSLWWVITPTAREAVELLPGVFLCIRGLFMPKLTLGWGAVEILSGISFCIIALWVAHWSANNQQVLKGQRPPYVAITGIGIIAIFIVLFIYSSKGVSVEWPVFHRTNFKGGITLTPELITIIVGLTYYTTGFIAEIARSGILAVPKGQWEAARSLGLKETRLMRLVILPQTLRVIVPPMTSQYINLVKNSTLAIAVGYPDFMMIMMTVINRTSHAIEGIFLIVVVYLIINLTLSAILNWYNRRIGLVER